MIVPKEYVGAVMELNNERRGKFDHMEYLSEERVHLTYELPLGEIVLDFYDQLKSRTRGYASFDYDLAGFRAGQRRPRRRPRRRRAGRRALADRPPRLRLRARASCSSSGCGRRSRARCSTSPSRPRSAPRMIARETVKARARTCSPSATAATSRRKRKLLEKQKEGKKRMKQVGGVEVPQEAFLAVLNLDERSK